MHTLGHQRPIEVWDTLVLELLLLASYLLIIISREAHTEQQVKKQRPLGVAGCKPVRALVLLDVVYDEVPFCHHVAL